MFSKFQNLSIRLNVRESPEIFMKYSKQSNIATIRVSLKTILSKQKWLLKLSFLPYSVEGKHLEWLFRQQWKVHAWSVNIFWKDWS